MTDTTINFEKIEWNQLNEHARQKKITLGNKAVRILELEPGFEELEWCIRAHYGYIIDGELEIQFRNRTEKFSAGQGLVISYGDEHKAIETKSKVRLFLVDEL